jgi:hypothetical protein
VGEGFRGRGGERLPITADSGMINTFRGYIEQQYSGPVNCDKDCRIHPSVSRPIKIDNLANLFLPEIQRIFLHNEFVLDNNRPIQLG